MRCGKSLLWTVVVCITWPTSAQDTQNSRFLAYAHTGPGFAFTSAEVNTGFRLGGGAEASSVQRFRRWSGW